MCSASCWEANLLPSLKSQEFNWFSSIFVHFSPSIFLSTLTTFFVLAEEKHPAAWCCHLHASLWGWCLCIMRGAGLSLLTKAFSFSLIWRPQHLHPCVCCISLCILVNSKQSVLYFTLSYDVSWPWSPALCSFCCSMDISSHSAEDLPSSIVGLLDVSPMLFCLSCFRGQPFLAGLMWWFHLLFSNKINRALRDGQDQKNFITQSGSDQKCCLWPYGALLFVFHVLTLLLRDFVLVVTPVAFDI